MADRDLAFGGPPVEPDRSFPLFDRYLAGECAPDEAADVARLVAHDPERARQLADQAAVRAAVAAADDASAWDVDALWRAVDARRTRHPAEVSPIAARRPTAARPTPRWNSRAWRVAAAWVGVAALGAGGALVWRAAGGLGVLPAPAVRAYTTQPGQQAAVQLVDGSRVTLAPSSTLLVPVAFGRGARGARDVQLDGQAYFEVASDPARPFRVRSGPAVTRVLGTRFDVRAYAGEGRVTVAVTEGRVRVGGADAGSSTDPAAAAADLAAGDLARVGRDGLVRVQRGGASGARPSWRDGWLAFVDAPLPEVLAELERWHGVRFELGDPSLAGRVLTTRLRPGALDVTLAVLEGALDVRAESTAAGVRLTRRAGSPSTR